LRKEKSRKGEIRREEKKSIGVSVLEEMDRIFQRSLMLYDK
jgi:hypothetical protein